MLQTQFEFQQSLAYPAQILHQLVIVDNSIPLRTTMSSLRRDVLPWASRHGYRVLIRQVIGHYLVQHARPFQDPTTRAPLSMSPLLGDDDLVVLFREHARPDMNPNDEDTEWLLATAVVNNFSGVVREIMERGHVTFDQFGYMRTIMCQLVDNAVRGDDEDILQLLIKQATDNTAFRQAFRGSSWSNPDRKTLRFLSGQGCDLRDVKVRRNSASDRRNVRAR